MIIILNLTSKNHVSLQNFVSRIVNTKLKIFVKITKKVNPTKFKLYSVLKSPHVNKIAQEQFAVKTYNIQLRIFLFQPNLFLIFLKTIKNILTSDIKINYKIILNKTLYKQYFKKIFNTNRLHFYRKKYKIFLLTNFIFFNFSHGEFLLKNRSLGSSVG